MSEKKDKPLSEEDWDEISQDTLRQEKAIEDHKKSLARSREREVTLMERIYNKIEPLLSEFDKARDEPTYGPPCKSCRHFNGAQWFRDTESGYPYSCERSIPVHNPFSDDHCEDYEALDVKTVK